MSTTTRPGTAHFINTKESVASTYLCRLQCFLLQHFYVVGCSKQRIIRRCYCNNFFSSVILNAFTVSLLLFTVIQGDRILSWPWNSGSKLELLTHLRLLQYMPSVAFSSYRTLSVVITTQLNSTQLDFTDAGADTSYVRIYMSNLIKTLCLQNFF